MMTWADFKLKFSKYHVPPGLIKKMRDEFRELKQGRMSVVEYRDRFLTVKRRRPGGPHHNNNYVHHNNNFNRAPPRTTPNQNNNNTNTAPRTGSNAIPATKDKSTITCYECGVVGHFSNECPKRLAKLRQHLHQLSRAPCLHRQEVRPNNPHNRGGRLYHMNAEEAQEAPDVVLAYEMAPLKPRKKVPAELVEVGESQVFGPDVLREAEEKVHKIREYLKTAQSRQKSYADKRRREMTFEIGDFVYLKVSPLKNAEIPGERKARPDMSDPSRF
ncbi:hypothetical protein QYE76_000749 [Lolium multiflorum]|uniref:CCHC-type domain-containing protein n=1 Tax=Lolium multiflorum TaxID=4521 RepID=A0AAD8VXX9_LOLMU|nr:hypothetical protein QYE76_000749 [Lolium multiflorum]